MSHLKVGLFNDSFPPVIDGVANTVANYARVIQQNHGVAMVVTPKYPHIKDNYPYEVYRYASIPMQKSVGYRAGNPFSPLTLAAINGRNLDIMHSHCPFVSALLTRQLQTIRKNVPVVFTYHTKFDVDIAKRSPKPLVPLMKKLVKSNIYAADEVWAVSNGAIQSLREMGYDGPCMVMENGTDFKHISAEVKPELKDKMAEIDRTYQLQPDELVFLFTGRMMWYKNIELILDSLVAVKKNGVKFRIFFAGDGLDLPKIKSYTDEIELTPQTIFLGAVKDRDQLYAFFSRADLFLFPSTYDTSGLVVKEAAACDLPSLLIEGSCAAEGVEDGYTGFLAHETVSSCADVITKAVRNKDKLKEIGKNAGKHVYLSWDDAVAKAYKRYGEIIENKKRKTSHTKKSEE